MSNESNNEKLPPKKDAAMKAKELQELLDFIAKSGLNKVNIETEEFKISVQRDPTTKHVVSMAAPAALPAPAPAAPATVHPGSYCSSAGATGVTVKGTPMVCKTTAEDSRLRWRSA